MKPSSSSINSIHQNLKLQVASGDVENKKYRKFSLQFIYIHDQT